MERGGGWLGGWRVLHSSGQNGEVVVCEGVVTGGRGARIIGDERGPYCYVQRGGIGEGLPSSIWGQAIALQNSTQHRGGGEGWGCVALPGPRPSSTITGRGACDGDTAAFFC